MPVVSVNNGNGDSFTAYDSYNAQQKPASELKRHAQAGRTSPLRYQHGSRCNAELYRIISFRVFQEHHLRHGHPDRIPVHQFCPEYSRTVSRAVTDMESLSGKADLGDRRSDGPPPGPILRHLSDIISGRTVHISYPFSSVCPWGIFCLEEMAGRRQIIHFFHAQFP